jgi:hypothetical protein
MRSVAGTGLSSDGEAPGGLDGGFIRRIYRTSFLVYVVVACYVAAYLGSAAWLGLTAGVALALGSLRLIEWSVGRFVTALSGKDRPARGAVSRAMLWTASAGKYLQLAAAVAAAVWAANAGYLNVIAFVGGILLVHTVIVLKAVGAWMFGPSAGR